MSNKTASLLRADEPKTEMKPENPYIPLTFKQYSNKAMSYRFDENIALNSLSGEVDALIDLSAKAPDGTNANKVSAHRSAVKKQIGGILWTLVAVAEDIEVTLEECALINLVKLRDNLEAETPMAVEVSYVV